MDVRTLKDKVTETGRKVWWKAKDIGQRAIDSGKSAVKWAIDNPDKAAAIAGAGAALAGGANKVVKSINRNVTAKQIEREKRTRVYDHSLNAYVYTKKPLSKEQIEFIHKERRRTGKKVSEIMAEMDILRR